MPLNKFRNQSCPCKSGKKFKYCCLQDHYDARAKVVTPIQKQEKAKEQKYWKKKYDDATLNKISASVGESSV